MFTIISTVIDFKLCNMEKGNIFHLSKIAIKVSTYTQTAVRWNENPLHESYSLSHLQIIFQMALHQRD